jgi:hypothetical protein
VIRLILAPWPTFRAWRTMVLAITDTERTLTAPHAAQLDIAQPDTAQPDTAQLDTAQPDIAQLDTAQPDSAQSADLDAAPVRPGESAVSPAPDQPPRHLAKPTPRRAPVKAARATPGAVDDEPPVAQRANGRRRPLDPRIAVLARHLASTQDADEVTYEQVGQILSMDIAPRTGRRLLGAARELLAQHPTPPPRTARGSAQRERRTLNGDDSTYENGRSGPGWAGPGLPHTGRPEPPDIDSPIASAASSAGQPS